MKNINFKKVVISMIIGFLLNPILVWIIILLDNSSSNVWLHGPPLVERMPFAYTYKWGNKFLYDGDYGLEFMIISNTILYSILIYICLNFLEIIKNLLYANTKK